MSTSSIVLVLVEACAAERYQRAKIFTTHRGREQIISSATHIVYMYI